MAPGELKTMLMQNFGVSNEEYYGMVWYFLEWSIVIAIYNLFTHGSLRSS